MQHLGSRIAAAPLVAQVGLGAAPETLCNTRVYHLMQVIGSMELCCHEQCTFCRCSMSSAC